MCIKIEKYETEDTDFMGKIIVKGHMGQHTSR